MKVGVQTRPWGPEMNRKNLAQVLAEVASAGYDGIEIGAQHLDVSKPEPFRQLLAEHGLSPAAIHVGGEIWNPESVKEALANLERAVEFTAAVGAPFLAFSGAMRENKSDRELANTAVNLERIGRLCSASGLKLGYHNHYWEIAGDCRELRYICENTDPDLVSLCLDVAWIQRGEEILPGWRKISCRAWDIFI